MESGESCITNVETLINTHHNKIKTHMNSTNNEDILKSMPPLIQLNCGYTNPNKVYTTQKLYF